jgi:hypothetical protein
MPAFAGMRLETWSHVSAQVTSGFMSFPRSTSRSLGKEMADGFPMHDFFGFSSGK